MINNDNPGLLPDLISDNLDILFVGYNPGTLSAATGHHYANKSNRFWKLLYESGLTPYKLSPEEDIRLLDFGYGSTNIVSRTTKSAKDITSSEFREGSAILKELIQRITPKIVCFVGIGVYRAFASYIRRIPESTLKVQTGIQEKSLIDEITDYVCSNPSGLNVIPYSEQLECFKNSA
ncbi:MAG: G/U mismatch-specific DNA glycosylase [Firmicutes bacterium ADurb.Bin419]|nr:MAG: G/U mismatch-specific DNA glycosylase [Firmicutes bacterium ADurb.Bin419]